jgi:lactobin A/cerein 7B family class IIb bacteriocin
MVRLTKKRMETEMRNAENTSDIRPLTDAELDDVSGGLWWALGGIVSGLIAGSILADYSMCGEWTCDL